MIDLVLIPLMAAHLLCVNVAAAGPLIAIWLERKAARGDQLARETAGSLAKASLLALLAGGLLGLIVGVLRWDDGYAALWLETMRSKAAWGMAEYGFSLLLASMYLLFRGREGQVWRLLRCLLLLLSGTNLLYHFPFLFSVATTVEFSSETASLTAADFRRWMIRPEVLSRAIHVILASFAVTGVLLMSLVLRRNSGEVAADGSRLARWGAWIALAPSLLQVPVGLWLIVALPASWQTRVLGGDLAAVLMLGSSVVLALWLLQELANIALGDVQRFRVVRSIVLMLVVVILMTGVLERMKPTDPAAYRPRPFETR